MLRSLFSGYIKGPLTTVASSYLFCKHQSNLSKNYPPRSSPSPNFSTLPTLKPYIYPLRIKFQSVFIGPMRPFKMGISGASLPYWHDLCPYPCFQLQVPWTSSASPFCWGALAYPIPTPWSTVSLITRLSHLHPFRQ